MPTIRSLRQPGPVHPSRIDCFRNEMHEFHFTLQPGITLNQALTAPFVETGFQCGTATFSGVSLDPLRYVIPGPPDNDSHVAYFSATHAPSGPVRIEQANATIGWSGGAPFIHCHAVWTECDGNRRGGHILPHETIVAGSTEVTGWGFRGIRIDQLPDPETNFALFQPSGASTATGNGLVVRVKPNQDIITALEMVSQTHGIRNAVIRGSLGSLIGASFTNGARADGVATEVLVRDGTIRDGKAALDLLVVDMQGRPHEGWIQRGQNPVCITFEIVLEDIDPRTL